jgi:hypothetical protein
MQQQSGFQFAGEMASVRVSRVAVGVTPNAVC